VPISEGLPTYFDVLNTYSQGVAQCITEANIDAIDASGRWIMSGIIPIINNELQVRCCGT
jgi:hypothetical protein